MMQKAKFIEIIRKYPILYDMTHEDFKNSFKKDQIWDHIGAEFNETGEDLKKKWKSLRDTYAKYIKRSCTEGTAKKWIWAEQMKFFRPFLSFTNKTFQSNAYDNSQCSDSDEQIFDNMPSVVDESEYIISENDYMGQDNQPIESVLFLQESPASPSIPETSMRQQTTFNISRARSLKRKCEPEQSSSLQEHYRNKTFKAVFDDMECLLLAHAKTIKNFSPKRQAITKYKIAQVILEQELLHVQECPARSQEGVKRERRDSGSSDGSYAVNNYVCENA